MRITKQIAADVAKKLLSKKNDELSEMQKQLSAKALEFYLETVPSDVLNLYKKEPSYMQSASSITLRGYGFSTENIYFGKNAPSKSQYSAYADLSQEANKTLRSLKDKVSDFKKEYDKTRIELEAALFSLRTYKNVEIHLPEATPFLPKKNDCTSLAINFDDLRNKIK